MGDKFFNEYLSPKKVFHKKINEKIDDSFSKTLLSLILD